MSGPLAAIAVGFGSPLAGEAGSDQAALNNVAAVAVLMAIWWLTEALPLAVTALAPLLLFPVLKIMPAADVAGQYGSRMIFLFLGGFLIALAIEESGLHRRVALRIVGFMGDQPRRIVLGFMLATAALSMWLSNTATTMMMLPIAASVLLQARGREGATEDGAPGGRRNFGVALMLGIAYSASIGGVSTIVGTPPNVFFSQNYGDVTGVTFGGWMLLAVPFSAVFLFLAWWLLVRRVFPVDDRPILGGGNIIADELDKLGPMREAEWWMLGVFLATASLWILREPWPGAGWAPWLGLGKDGKTTWVDDGTVAIGMAMLCFLVPASVRPYRPVLQWEATKRLPWGILLLVGGGIALAGGMNASGLDRYLGGQLAQLIGGMPDAGKVAAMAGGMTFLTELTSNLASVQMILPVLSDAAKDLAIEPRLLMIPVTLAASCAFMLPVATPPNAIVYGSGEIRIKDMAKAGLWMNLMAIALITVVVLLWS